MYINKATILGNLTRDPELKSIPTGMKVATFSLATNRTWKDASGVRKDASEYHNVVAFGRQAELIAQYAKKGSSLFIEGRLQTRSWDDASGQKKYRTEIIVENFQFGPRPQGAPGTASTSMPKEHPTKESTKEEDDSLDTIEYPNDDINVDDIPF
jgi:single-strand DNA-binding protein